jgi:hypothetical protein
VTIQNIKIHVYLAGKKTKKSHLQWEVLKQLFLSTKLVNKKHLDLEVNYYSWEPMNNRGKLK